MTVYCQMSKLAMALVSDRFFVIHLSFLCSNCACFCSRIMKTCFHSSYDLISASIPSVLALSCLKQ